MKRPEVETLFQRLNILQPKVELTGKQASSSEKDQERAIPAKTKKMQKTCIYARFCAIIAKSNSKVRRLRAASKIIRR